MYCTLTIKDHTSYEVMNSRYLVPRSLDHELTDQFREIPKSLRLFPDTCKKKGKKAYATNDKVVCMFLKFTPSQSLPKHLLIL